VSNSLQESLSENGVEAWLNSVSDTPSKENLGAHIAVGVGVEEEDDVEDAEVVELVELADVVDCGV
jgi:hypothetical protein